MIVATSVADLRRLRSSLAEPLGFVPTMGYLHDGHLSLARAARAANRSVVASIFVNPLQFGPQEDFAAYPRDPDRDLRLLSDSGVDLVFVPDVASIYPSGFSSSVAVGAVGDVLEGASRPGHFRGVATVVSILFNLVRPTRAYFGQKDAQQCVVIKKLVADLAFPIEIVIGPTVRESDGLALSSRNVYLSVPERIASRVLSASLQAARRAFEAGRDDAETLRQIVRTMVGAEPLARLDYVSVADAASLDELKVVDRPAVVSLAVWIGRTRLIDNDVLSSA
ncbi:MAG TPA: pantoate--beta-alanine ligase [Chloroflexota bacterium]|nr:pantoate--beta-alanine ligase [Chloroflexota bacterium]